MAEENEDRTIRNAIVKIIDHDEEVKKNAELLNIFRTAYFRREAGKPMREVALALDKSLAAYITNHDDTPESVLKLHREMMKMSDI